MDNWEAAIQAAATRLGVTLKVKQVEVIMAFISGSDVLLQQVMTSPWSLAFYHGSAFEP